MRYLLTSSLQKTHRMSLTSATEDDILYMSLSGGIGRHKRLKISRPFGRAGSIPASSTINNNKGREI